MADSHDVDIPAAESTPKSKDNIDKEKEKPYEARIHSNWLESYVNYTSYQESPTLFHIWNGISVLAGALNRNTYIQRGYNRLYPNLYTVLVSPPGRSKKSASAGIGVNKFLQKVDGVRILRDELTPKGLVHYLSMSPVHKVSATKFVQNCTAFVYAAELSDMIGEQSYNLGLIKKLTNLWDSPDIYDDTTKDALVKNKEPTRLTNVCLNILGCSNPEWLAHGLKEDSFGGGFMGRTLFVYSEETRKTRESAWMEVPPEVQLTELTLLRDLQKISKLKGAFKIQNDAYEHFASLYLNYNGDFTGRMAGYLERKLTFALKLAMILSVNFNDEMLIYKEHIDTAMQYLDEIERVMPNAFVYISTTNEARIAQHIIEAMRESGGVVYRNQLLEKFRHTIRNIREFDDIMQMLIESRVIKQMPKDNKIIYVFMALFEKLEKDMEKQINREVQAQAQAQAANIKNEETVQ